MPSQTMKTRTAEDPFYIFIAQMQMVPSQVTRTSSLANTPCKRMSAYLTRMSFDAKHVRCAPLEETGGSLSPVPEWKRASSKPLGLGAGFGMACHLLVGSGDEMRMCEKHHNLKDTKPSPKRFRGVSQGRKPKAQNFPPVCGVADRNVSHGQAGFIFFFGFKHQVTSPPTTGKHMLEKFRS